MRRTTAFAAAFLGACSIALAVVLLGGAGAAQPGAGGAELAELDITAPAALGAGTPLELQVGTDAATVDVTLIGPWGARTLDDAPAAGGTVTVDGSLTTFSGRLLVVVADGTRVGRVTVDVVPGRPVDGTVPLAGPRSMTADAAHWTMVTSLPVDRFGNAIVDGTEVTVRIRRPDGSIASQAALVDGMVAATRVFSETLAGRTALRLGVNGAAGPEVEVLEVPGPPVEVTVAAPTAPLRADGRTLVELATDTLVDAFGNQMLDGTVAVITTDGPDGRGTSRSVTIDGRVGFVVEAPTVPGTLSLVVDVDGVSSEPIDLVFDADLAQVPARATRLDDNRVEVAIGPVLTELGGFVADGTIAEIIVAGSVHEVALVDGLATLELAADPGVPIAVQVLGTTTAAGAP